MNLEPLKLCPTCQSPLASDAPLGLCPKCLLKNRFAETRLESCDDVPLPVSRIGDYELIAEIARGGMGVVYKARQSRLNRIVALKMILKGEFASDDEIQRFHSEAQAAGSLEHPNILPVYEVGLDENRHFFSMRLIEGGSLERRLAASTYSNREAALLLMTVARAVHHAHQHGILHRDLKPANILIDSAGIPHVSDFGLAKSLTHETGATRSGSVIGTPAYMSPEQAAGNSRKLTVASDIYSLGAILYEMLAGRAPFDADTTMELLKQVVEQEPQRPRKINPRIERDIEAICLKCLEKDPRRRYASAEALAEDLQRFLDSERVIAAQSNVIRRLTRTLERSQHDAEFAAWGVMLICFGVVIFIGHLATFLLIQTHQPESTLWFSRAAQLAVETLVFWRLRPRTNLPATAVERQLWSIWLGFIVAYIANAFACRALIIHDIMGPGDSPRPYWNELITYPGSSILAGLAFFIMGSNYWGRCYQFGLAFFGLALLMPLKFNWSPLAFGGLACAVLVIFGLHLRKLAHNASK